MKYLSIDIETTGVDSELDQILSIGIVIEDTEKKLPMDELPSLHLVIIRDRLEGNVFALNMNKNIINILKDYQVSDEHQRKAIEVSQGIKFVRPNMITYEIYRFLAYHDMVSEKLIGLEKPILDKQVIMYKGKAIPSFNDALNEKPSSLTVAGKNFGTFDKLFLEKLPKWNDVFKVHQRIIDPAPLYWNPEEDGDTLPNLSTCLKRAGFNDVITHDAIDDAKDVIRVVRHLKY